MKTRILVSTLVLLLSTPLPGFAANVMYKYTNDQGDRVFSYTLPPGQARHGYQKIELGTGKVLETVAPQLPPDELAEQQRREQALRDCRNELRRIYTLYGTERDIQHAEAQSLESLERRVGQLQANLAIAERERAVLQGQAADAERAGRQIPASLVDKIERSQAQIDALQAEVVQRRDEQDRAQQRYRRELERFRDGTCPEPELDVAARGGAAA